MKRFKGKEMEDNNQISEIDLSRRRGLGALAAGTAALATGISLGSEGLFPEKAAAANAPTQGFANAPSGGDDSALIYDAIKTGKILGPYSYRCDKVFSDLGRVILQGIPGATSINVNGAGFIDTENKPWDFLWVSGVDFHGRSDKRTYGFIRNRFSGDNVGKRKTILDCLFYNYTRYAVAMNQRDNPYVTVERCQFYGANSTTTVGIALNGGNDLSSVRNNSFLKNKIGLSVTQGGGAHLHVEGNDFLNFDAGTGRVGVWVVPVPTIQNSGQGMTVSKNKFGNENRDPNDFATLYADKGAGFAPGSRFAGDFGPALRKSKGYINLHAIYDNDFSGRGASQKPPIVTYTPNFGSSRIGPNFHSGTAPKTELFFAGDLPNFVTGTRVDPGFAWWNTQIAHSNASSANVKKVG